MMALQTNPDDTTTNCYASVQKTNEELLFLFDYNNYQPFDPFSFLDFFNQFLVYLDEQQMYCGHEEYMIKIDQMMS